MQITRNRPGVSTCDNCRAEKRPVVSWTCLDNSDGYGASIVGTVHLCAPCLQEHADRLAELPPFMEVMRYQLSQVGKDVPPKARYDEILAQYQQEGLGDVPVPEQIAQPEQPTIPEIRRMAKADLQAVIARYGLDIQPETMTREQMIDELVRYFETVTAGSAV